MKISKIIFALILFAISESGLRAQVKKETAAGLFVTASDFQQQKLTYQVDCNNPNDKIKANTFFGSSTGYVLCNGEKHIFNKKDVYGYRNCQNKSYRFYNGDAYQLMDTLYFYIYYKYAPAESPKGREMIKKDEYFFSVLPDGVLQALTIENLKNAFPDNHNFHYSIDANFKLDRDLMAYDKFQKCYKIKYLFKKETGK
jgi:hypothetical protein